MPRTPWHTGKGTINLDDFLTQARTSDEAEELTSLFHFFETTLGLQGEKCLTFDSFAEGTLANTPLGKLRVAAFQSAVRGMTADVKKARQVKAVAVS